jgi:hypothetical protein
MQVGRGRNLFLLVLAETLMWLAAGTLAAQDVRYNFMPGTDFSKYHTYRWVSIEGGEHPNQIVDARIKQSVDSQLASKGMTRTDNDKADLYLAYQVAVSQETQWNGYNMRDGIRWGGTASATSSTIHIGTLVLDMYDPATKQLVWTGNATKTLDPSSNQEKNQKKLNKAMQKLLKNYPPKQK